MNQNRKRLPQPKERINLPTPGNPIQRRLLSFVAAAAILIAAFSAGSLWTKNSGIFRPDAPSSDETGFSTGNDTGSTLPPDRPALPPAVPEGCVPIVSETLSADAYKNRIRNETPYSPDMEDLQNRTSYPILSVDGSKGPAVLILHTHGSEAYLNSKQDYLEGNLGDLVYSTDEARTVVAVGEALSKELIRQGVPTVHCRELHGDGGSLRNSYAKAAECIRQYLKAYPSIQYVIDLHRDSFFDGNGNYIRTEASWNGESFAQVMAVVGSDCNGTEHPEWKADLSLALHLSQQLNLEVPSVSRPVSLRCASYNQELAPRSLLLEIGTGANTVEEAVRTARLVGQQLAILIRPPQTDGAN